MTTQSEERRRDERKPTLLGAKVVFNDRRSTMNCRVRNLGAHGARLRFDGPPLVPSHFELIIEQMDRRHIARRVWVSANDMGVAFD